MTKMVLGDYFHSLIVVSQLHDATTELLSGCQATPMHTSACALTDLMILDVFQSQKKIFPDPSPLTTVLSSVENAGWHA